MNAAWATWAALGSTAHVQVADGRALGEVRATVEAELDALDRACSRFRDDSELAHVNRAAGRPVAVGELLLAAVETALWAAQATGGAVDPTVGCALIAAGYDRDFAGVRGSGAPLRAAAVAGWRAVAVDRSARTVGVPAGTALDLGATAKALGADRAARAAARRAGCGVLVSLGGDIAVAGTAPAEGWAVAVRDDHRPGASLPAQTVGLHDGGLATSSTTVRRWRRGAGTAHHIIDPATGLPAAGAWRTVSVAAATCVEANAASTAAIVLGGRAVAWLAAAGLPARLVTADGAVCRTGGWPAEGARA